MNADSRSEGREATVELDGAVLGALRDVGGDALVDQLLELFLEYTPTRIAGIRSGLDEGDLSAVAYWAHSLRSGAASIGAESLAERAGVLERIVRRSAPPGAPQPETPIDPDVRDTMATSLTDLVACYEELQESLRGRLGARSPIDEAQSA